MLAAAARASKSAGMLDFPRRASQGAAMIQRHLKHAAAKKPPSQGEGDRAR